MTIVVYYKEKRKAVSGWHQASRLSEVDSCSDFIRLLRRLFGPGLETYQMRNCQGHEGIQKFIALGIFSLVFKSKTCHFTVTKALFMTEWYIRHRDEQLGPYSLEELKLVGLSANDYVWTHGLPEWVKAADVQPLQGLWTSIPNKTPSKENTVKYIKRKLLTIAILFLLAIIFYLII